MSNKMVLKSIASDSTARMNTQLAVNRLDVPIDRVRTYNETLGDLSVSQTHCEQMHHLDLTCGQRFIKRRRRHRCRPDREIITIMCDDTRAIQAGRDAFLLVLKLFTQSFAFFNEIDCWLKVFLVAYKSVGDAECLSSYLC